LKKRPHLRAIFFGTALHEDFLAGKWPWFVIHVFDLFCIAESLADPRLPAYLQSRNFIGQRLLEFRNLSV
jgi:hypothetical protein